MSEYLKFGIIIVILIFVQKSLIWLIAVTEYQITPDLVLIGVVYMGINNGKIAASVSGFLSGLVYDLMSFSFVGLSALSKSTAGFIAGFFNNENKKDRYTQSYIFLLIVFLSSIFNNFLYFILYFQGTTMNLFLILIRYIIPTAIYTAILSIPLMLFLKRKSGKRF